MHVDSVCVCIEGVFASRRGLFSSASPLIRQRDANIYIYICMCVCLPTLPSLSFSLDDRLGARLFPVTVSLRLLPTPRALFFFPFASSVLSLTTYIFLPFRSHYFDLDFLCFAASFFRLPFSTPAFSTTTERTLDNSRAPFFSSLASRPLARTPMRVIRLLLTYPPPPSPARLDSAAYRPAPTRTRTRGVLCGTGVP